MMLRRQGGCRPAVITIITSDVIELLRAKRFMTVIFSRRCEEKSHSDGDPELRRTS
jgi:hypothetical protein